MALGPSGAVDIEYSALQMLIEGDKRATEPGATVWLAGLNPAVMASVRACAGRMARPRTPGGMPAGSGLPHGLSCRAGLVGATQHEAGNDRAREGATT